MKAHWEIKKLSEVMSIERGGSPRPIKKYLTNSPDGINWIKISDATASDKYIYATKEKITREGLHKTRVVNDGDFLLSNSMSFGRPGLHPSHWTNYVRVTDRITLIPYWEKGACHETKEIQQRVQAPSSRRTVKRHQLLSPALPQT